MKKSSLATFITSLLTNKYDGVLTIEARKEIKNLLLSKKYKFFIVSNGNGHNYHPFADKITGQIIFNNPNIIIKSRSLANGLLLHGIESGNNLNYSDIVMMEAITKKIDIIKSITDINEDIINLQKEKKIKEEQLKYLIEINKNIFNEDEFINWKKNKVVKSLD